MDRVAFDGVLVSGAGLAGLSAALAAAPRRALVISPTPLGEGASSAWAQGGLAAALGEDDAPALHAADTLAAGVGLADAEAVARLTAAGPEAVRRLAALGAPFDRKGQGFRLSLEAAHSRPRVARVGGDGAGKAIMAAVIEAARRAESVTVWEGARVRALLQDGEGAVRGALVERHGATLAVEAAAVVMATGGIGGLYAVTTNPPTARGEGLGLAALAGAVIADPEFVQFHPTAIDVGLDPAPLATEALRGDGARLVDAQGRPFMPDYDARGELAPRDVVARAIHRQRETGQGAFLDAREAVGAHFPEAFPGVFAACLAAGLDPRLSPIPVAPAEHYHMGGIEADAGGLTSLPGLYAAGECAATGVHGANRLASNSLLEAWVFGASAGQAAASETSRTGALEIAAPAPDLPAAAWPGLRAAMSQHAGVLRDGAGLQRLVDHLDRLDAAHGQGPALATARLVATAALARRESRGAHARLDFPAASTPPARTRLILAGPAPGAALAAE